MRPIACAILALVLTGCAGPTNPALARFDTVGRPADVADAHLLACWQAGIADPSQRPTWAEFDASSGGAVLFGAAGAVVGSAIHDSDADQVKARAAAFQQIVDACMHDRGYALRTK